MQERMTELSAKHETVYSSLQVEQSMREFWEQQVTPQGHASQLCSNFY
jgi:hypothetical protein